jgi:hypothetical protein
MKIVVARVIHPVMSESDAQSVTSALAPASTRSASSTSEERMHHEACCIRDSE